MFNTELDKFITKTIVDNYDKDYNPYNTNDPYLFGEFPLNLFYDNKEFLKNLEESKIKISFDRKMINRCMIYFKDYGDEDVILYHIREGDFHRLSILYAISIANKISRKHIRNGHMND
jgi:hypothetical protein|tara:strand:- start:23 stop:376 length:354 start_codon:yes stop_codon:yes gene_type:complete